MRLKPLRPEAVLIKSSEGVSCAVILKNLKSRVNPEELEARIGGIRETRSKDLLVEVIRESGSIRHLVPTVEVEILDIDPTVEDEEIAEAVWSFLRKEPSRKGKSNKKETKSKSHQ